MTATLLLNVPSKPARRGFPSAVCIKCGDASGAVRVRLDDVDEFSCDSCNETFMIADVRKHLAVWSAVLTWLSTCPETK
jgi:hypothetical protein